MRCGAQRRGTARDGSLRSGAVPRKVSLGRLVK
jgi:hypothetical protein